ncbi:hypothetical protein Tco_0581205 [Tanacetum coccineum]
MDLKLKPLPDNLEYVFLEEPSFLPVIISSQLTKEKKNKLIFVLKKHKQAFAWKTTDIHGICPSFCKHKIQLLDDKKLVVQKQRRLNPNMQKVVKKVIVKLLDTDIIYPIANSPWVSPIHCVPKKGGITIVINENDELVPTRTITSWRMLILSLIGKNVTSWSKKELCSDTRNSMLQTRYKMNRKVACRSLIPKSNDETSDDSEVDDNFPGETLMEINTISETLVPQDFANT